MNTSSITASLLYNFIQCPHRIWRDRYGPQEEKIQETNPFVQLLWDRGVQHEHKIVQSLGTFIDLSQGSIDQRFKKTLEELKKGSPLLYQGVLKYENLLGIPDLLKRLPDGSYIPMDIKSGRGLAGIDEDEGEEGKPKKHYAVQLCLYVEILQALGLAREKKGRVIDILGDEVEYLLEEPQGKRTPETWWDLYEQAKRNAWDLIENRVQNKPALAAVCKLCPWYTSCKNWCHDTHDLTTIFYLGRSKRDVINSDLSIDRLEDFDQLDAEKVLALKKDNKNFLRGIGEQTLLKLKRRANVLLDHKHFIDPQIQLPHPPIEIFFDLENDPTQDFVYLHGVFERKNGKEKYIYFLAKETTRISEKEAFQEFWKYLGSLPVNGFAAYYYSAHEKTIYRKMQTQYPDVISKDELESFFSNPNTIDLYLNVVLKHTEWPLSSYSIKELATYLGFKWRDKTPSGALSIQWYNEYSQTQEPALLKRIMEYNEDDCKAMMILKDAIEKFTARNF
jgi:uncharacterized protein